MLQVVATGLEFVAGNWIFRDKSGTAQTWAGTGSAGGHQANIDAGVDGVVERFGAAVAEGEAGHADVPAVRVRCCAVRPVALLVDVRVTSGHVDSGGNVGEGQT